MYMRDIPSLIARPCHPFLSDSRHGSRCATLDASTHFILPPCEREVDDAIHELVISPSELLEQLQSSLLLCRQPAFVPNGQVGWRPYLRFGDFRGWRRGGRRSAVFLLGLPGPLEPALVALGERDRLQRNEARVLFLLLLLHSSEVEDAEDGPELVVRGGRYGRGCEWYCCCKSGDSRGSESRANHTEWT